MKLGASGRGVRPVTRVSVRCIRRRGDDRGHTTLLTQLALGTFLIAALMLLMSEYGKAFTRVADDPTSVG